MSLVNIVALGGVQETGKNLYVVECDNYVFVLDAGMKYPASTVYGIDVVLPDITYLISKSNKIAGIFLTHAHDDHIAAIPHILKYMRVPVYGTSFTLAVVKELLTEHNMNPADYDLKEVTEATELRFGRNQVKFIGVNHSVPEAVAIAIKTPDGNIVYTGNYNFDQNGHDLYKTNYEQLTRIASEKVLALLPESIAAINDINRGSIIHFEHRLNKIFMNAKGRIVISLFSTNLQRIQQIVDIAVRYNKKIAIIGRKTQRIVNIAINSGYLKVDQAKLVNLRYIDEKNRNNGKDLVVLVTGERHEPYFMLQRMCRKIDRLIHIEANDTVAVLTRPAIGTEKMAARTLDMIYKSTNNVINFPTELILSASSGYEEAKQMINILKPKYIFPVIGEYRHQYNMLNLAKGLGYQEDSLHVLELGNMVSITDGICDGVTKTVPYGEIMLDGKGLGNVNNAVIRDREILAENGVLMFVANVNAKARNVVSKPEIVAKGFYCSADDIKEMMTIFEDCTAKVFEGRFINWVEYKNDLKNDLTKYINKKTKTNPLIIPVIISTDLPEKEEKNV